MSHPEPPGLGAPVSGDRLRLCVKQPPHFAAQVRCLVRAPIPSRGRGLLVLLRELRCVAGKTPDHGP